MFRDLALAVALVALFGSTVGGVSSLATSQHLDTTLRALPSSAPVEGFQLWTGAVADGTLDSLQLATAVDGPGPALAVFRVRWETTEGVPLCTVELDCSSPAGSIQSAQCAMELANGDLYRARAYSFCTGGAIPSGTITAAFFWK